MSVVDYANVGSTPSLVTTCNVIAASVFVLYDHLITFGDEGEVHMVFAYYGRNKALLASLLFLLAGNLAAVVAMVGTSLPQAIFASNDVPAFHAGSCIGSSIPLKFSSFCCFSVDHAFMAFSSSP
ncbi:hypothetical protein JB92DRAFT_2838762 [Gautieria morchelliformis]|nr:hypothetical protein JB92DRAFT_2838762 [Gautieria morchelliformis]